jgi:hypothetical protein
MYFATIWPNGIITHYTNNGELKHGN